jgi:hypothetical protein
MSAIRPPRTLEELLDREEALAERGIARGAQLLGADVRDALNLPLHWRRKPLQTSAIVGALGLALVGYARRPRQARRRGRSGLGFVMKNLLSTSLAGAAMARVGKTLGIIRD